MDVAQRIADALLEGFNRHYALFRATSADAKTAFEAGDWAGVQRLVKQRIRFYDTRVLEYVERLRALVADRTLEDSVWQEAKLRYVGLLIDQFTQLVAGRAHYAATIRKVNAVYRERLCRQDAALTSHFL